MGISEVELINKHLLSAYYMPAIVLATRALTVNKTKFPTLMMLTSWQHRHVINMSNKKHF